LTRQLQAGMMAPLCQASTSSTSLTWYRVAFCGGISVRGGPDLESPPSGTTLPCNAVFAVSGSIVGHDQRVYLRLADGSGWAFDDSMLFPDNPSVYRLPFVETSEGLPIDSPCGKTTSFETAPQTPIVYQEECVTVPAGHFATNPTPPSPIRRGPLSTTPASTFASSGNENGIAVMPLVSIPYQVQVSGGICVRCAPDMEAPLTGVHLCQGEVFHVSGSMIDTSGRQFLRLADQQGWVLAETEHAGQDQAAQHANDSDKKKTKESKAHVPYWVRLRRAKLAGTPVGQRKGKNGTTKV